MGECVIPGGLFQYFFLLIVVCAHQLNFTMCCVDHALFVFMRSLINSRVKDHECETNRKLIAT